MKKKIMVGMVGMVLIGLASAGLVDFLSNSVSGTVEVRGPVFYLDKEDIMDSDSFSLRMNDDDIVDDGMFTLGNSFKLREFISESLGIDGKFYEHDFLVTLDAKAVNYDENKSGALEIEVDVLREDGSPRGIELCSVAFMQIEGRSDYEILCECDNYMDEMESSDRLRLSIRDWSSSEVTEEIYIYGDSKMEVIAK